MSQDMSRGSGRGSRPHEVRAGGAVRAVRVVSGHVFRVDRARGPVWYASPGSRAAARSRRRSLALTTWTPSAARGSISRLSNTNNKAPPRRANGRGMAQGARSSMSIQQPNSACLVSVARLRPTSSATRPSSSWRPTTTTSRRSSISAPRPNSPSRSSTATPPPFLDAIGWRCPEPPPATVDVPFTAGFVEQLRQRRYDLDHTNIDRLSTLDAERDPKERLRVVRELEADREPRRARRTVCLSSLSATTHRVYLQQCGRSVPRRVERTSVTPSSLLMADHYGWTADPSAAVVRRTFRAGSRTWTIASPVEVPVLPEGHASSEVTSWVLELDALSDGALTGEVHVQRVSTPTVWEALATGVLRQVVRAGTARERYRRLVAAASNDGGFPSPDEVLRCDEDEMTALGLRFCWSKLVALARWAADVGADECLDIPSRDGLLEDAASLPGLGPWTLGVAAWDCGNDPARYPFGDYVVQAGAARLVSWIDWPRRPDRFALAWSDHCGDDFTALTVLALLAADDEVWQSLTLRSASVLAAPR